MRARAAEEERDIKKRKRERDTERQISGNSD